jgi:Protein of unknown function (DUF1569)
VKSLATARDREEILRRLREVRPESPRLWGRMSAHQMICHLSDSFRMAIGQKPVASTRGPLRQKCFQWVALYLPLRWPAGAIRTRPEIDQETGGTPPADFAADVAKLERLFQLVTAEPRRVEWKPHPMFGTMSDAAWLRWGYLHMDHHLRQFRK